MISARDLIGWLRTFPPDTMIGIDEDGSSILRVNDCGGGPFNAERAEAKRREGATP